MCVLTSPFRWCCHSCAAHQDVIDGCEGGCRGWSDHGTAHAQIIRRRTILRSGQANTLCGNVHSALAAPRCVDRCVPVRVCQLTSVFSQHLMPYGDFDTEADLAGNAAARQQVSLSVPPSLPPCLSVCVCVCLSVLSTLSLTLTPTLTLLCVCSVHARRIDGSRAACTLERGGRL